MNHNFETIRLETDARGVATLTLARPDKHNALSAQMIAELTGAAAQLAADRAVRVVILTGEGASFAPAATWTGCASSLPLTAPPARPRHANWRLC